MHKSRMNTKTILDKRVGLDKEKQNTHKILDKNIIWYFGPRGLIGSD